MKKKKTLNLHERLKLMGLFEDDIIKEKWIYIDGNKSVYKVRSNGEVISTEYQGVKRKKPLFMSGGLDKNGYHIVSLTYDKHKYTRKVHRLVAEAFIPNPYNKPEVNHKDGNKLNNRVSNLEWAETVENVHHARYIGLRETVLRVDQVVPVCELLSSNLYSIREIMLITGISISNIEKIYKHKTWKNISNLYDIDNYNPTDHIDKSLAGKRLTKNQVINICKDIEGNNGSLSEISKRYDTSIHTVRKIFSGETHTKISKDYDFSNYVFRMNQFK